MKKTTQPYEILIRFKEGIYSGSQIQDEEIILDDNDNIYSSKVLEARPIYKGSEEYKNIVNKINTDLIKENDSLKAKIILLEG